MRVEINGELRELENGVSLGDAVVVAGATREERGVAVAVDGEVVPRSEWDSLRLTEGRKVEVVRAIQGG